MNEEVVKIECNLSRIFYPKNATSVKSSEFAIFSADVLRALDEYTEELGIRYIKLKGRVCKLEFGAVYKVYAKLAEKHETYGDTYEIIHINKVIDISDTHKQKEFLRHIINENTVENLFDMYDDVIELFENKDVSALTKVKGIGNKTALKLIEAYEDSKDYSTIYMELGEMGLTPTLIKRLVDYYHSPDVVVDKVRKEPYELVSIDGIGFKRADEIARKAGVTEFNPKRIKAFLLWHLRERAEVGQSYLYYDELMKNLYDTLGFVPEESVVAAAKDMVNSDTVITLDNGNIIALKRFYNLEKNIMKELYRLQNGRGENDEHIEEFIQDKSGFRMKQYVPPGVVVEDWKKIVKDVEDEQGFKFTEEQLNAIQSILDNNVLAITGSGGTGKTSVAKGMLSLYDMYSISACALSGKASVRITEATGYDASTIHRLLGCYGGTFLYNKCNKLPTDIVLIDEATMVNGDLFYSLLQAIPTGAKVIIMGDVQQLTPIGNCQVFADILESNTIPICRLTKPHRQAMRSGIVPSSIKIANQEQLFPNSFEGIQVLGELQDMELDISKDKTGLAEKVINHFKSEMDKWNNIMEVQICVPVKTRGDLSCFNLNNKIQAMYNPRTAQDEEIQIFLEKSKNEEAKAYHIHKGDKVINTKNTYCFTSDGDGVPVYNGNMGIVLEIEDGIATINFDGIGEVIFEKKQTKYLELAYACTTHKLQGSGFISTIVGMSTNSYIMNNSELLYTAITRAKKYCILVGDNYAISKAIQTKEVNTKRTFLKDMLIENSYLLEKNEVEE